MGDKIVKSKNLCCQPVVFPSLSLLSAKGITDEITDNHPIDICSVVEKFGVEFYG